MSGAASSTAIECEADIIRAVSAARAAGGTVRAVGAMGSKNGCWATEGVVLDLSGYDAVIAFDGASVTVQAGMRIGRLNEFLRARGKVVPTCGEWQGATVVGSTATGSHGGSAHHGIHSSSILSIRLVTANGTVMDIGRESPYFNHAAVSMGVLGVVSTITLACVDTFHLELETRVLAFDRFLDCHDALTRGSEFFATVWFPSARRVLTFSANRVPARAPTAPRMERFSITTILLDAASRYLDVHGVSDRLLAGRTVDHADRIICPIAGGSKRVQTMRAASAGVKAMEAAVPLASAPEALQRLDRMLHEHRHARLNAVGLRPSLADSFSLSPCHERDTLWVDLFFRGGHPEFAATLARTTEELEGRCHWGKHIGLSARQFASQYRRLPEFRRAQAELDPDRMFASAFTRSIGL